MVCMLVESSYRAPALTPLLGRESRAKAREVSEMGLRCAEHGNARQVIVMQLVLDLMFLLDVVLRYKMSWSTWRFLRRLPESFCWLPLL